MKIHEVLNLNMANSGLGERSRIGIYSTCENKRKMRNYIFPFQSSFSRN